MSRYMPASNLPVDEAMVGVLSEGFPDIGSLRNDEWDVYFDDFAGPEGDVAAAAYFDNSTQWTTTDQGTMTDVPDLAVGGGHSLAVFATDVTGDEGYEIQKASAGVQAIAGRTILFEALVGVEDVSLTDVFIGINELDSDFITPTGGAVALNNGVGFRLLASETTGTWACVHGGSTGGTVDVGDAGTGSDATISGGSNVNFVRLGFKLVGLTPTVEWFYNGVSVQTTTATIFDAASTVSFSVLGAGAVEILWVDYVMLAQTRG